MKGEAYKGIRVAVKRVGEAGENAFSNEVGKMREPIGKEGGALRGNKEEHPRLEAFIENKARSRPQGMETRILADSREMGSKVVKKLSEMGAQVVVEKLDIGDYVLSDRCIVERKTSTDFATSIIDGRLFSQATSLRDACDRPLVLIEGKKVRRARNIRPESVMGAVACVLVDYGIPVFKTRGPQETALLLFLIAKREQSNERKLPHVRAGRKPQTLKEMQEFVVAGLPNIDRVRGRRLLEEFETVERIFTSSEKELSQVRGVGKKIAMRIRKVLTSSYREEETDN